MSRPSLVQIADDLYAEAPADFTAARDAQVKELKGTDLAAQVKALRKPSVAAWAVNLLVRRDPAQVDQLLAVGESLRAAQKSMSADQLRTLTKQRRQVTAAVTVQARGLASEAGTRVSESVADQIETTLTAAMVDVECARAVRSGLLVRSLQATGVDSADVADAVACPEALGFAATPRATTRSEAPAGRGGLHVVPDPEANAKALAVAERALQAAQDEVDRAEAERDELAGEIADLEARGLQIQAEIDELKRRLAGLEETMDDVDEELVEAEEVRTAGDVALAALVRTRDEAQRAVDKLG